MKEYYAAFITSALCAIPPVLAYEYSGSPFIPHILFGTVSACFFVRGLILLFPFPFDIEVRSELEKAHPETIGMCRSDRVRIFKQWKSNEK